MQPDLQLDSVIRSELSRQIEEAGANRVEISLALGKSRNHLTRKLNGTVGLKTSELQPILRLAGIPSDDFMAAVLERLGRPRRHQSGTLPGPLEIPASLFAKLLEGAIQQPLKKNEILELEEATPEVFLGGASLDASICPSDVYLNLLEQIDSHPGVAFELARSVVLESAKAIPENDSGVLEHASLLNAWAIAALRKGRISFAAALAARAFLLHGTANLSPTFPPLLRTAACIFHDLGERRTAISVAQYALFFAAMSEDEVGRAKSALALSNRYLVYGFPEEATRVISSLRSVPDEVRFRVEYNRAFIKFRLEQYRDARSDLRAVAPGNRREEIHHLWLEAKILMAEERTDEALDVYRSLLERSSGHLQPSQHLIIFLELVPLLREQGDIAVTKFFATYFLGDFEALEMNKAASRLRDDVIAAATHGLLRVGLERDHRELLSQDS